MTQIILFSGGVLALLAVGLSISHLRLALTARKTFVKDLSDWISKDYVARSEVESFVSQSSDRIDDGFYEKLLQRVQSLPDPIKSEIVSGLQNNSQEGRSRFIASILSEVLLYNNSGREELYESPAPYSVSISSSSWGGQLPRVWSGAAGFAIGVVTASLALMLVNMPGSGSSSPDGARLPTDLAELQQRAEAQEIARQIHMLALDQDAQLDEQVEQLTSQAIRTIKDDRILVKPVETVWRLNQLGNLYLKVGEYDKAKASLEAAAKIASELGSDDKLGIYKDLGDLYVYKGDPRQAEVFYTRSLSSEPGGESG